MVLTLSAEKGWRGERSRSARLIREVLMEEDIRELELERWVNISERSGILSDRNEHEQKHRGIAPTG